MQTSNGKTVTTADAVEIVGCSKYDLYRARDEKQIEAEKVGGVIRWPLSGLGALRVQREREGRRGGTVGDKWARGEQVGIHKTIERLEADGKVMLEGARRRLRDEWGVDISAYRLRKILRAEVPWEPYGEDAKPVFRIVDIDAIGPALREREQWNRSGTLSIAETAARLGVEIDAVYNHLRRGRLRLDDPELRPKRVTIESIQAYEDSRHPTHPNAKAAIHALKLCTRNDAAKQLGISRSRMRDLMYADWFTTVRRQASTRVVDLIPQSEIDAALDERHPCACGCGTLVYRWNQYAVGHRMRVNEPIDWLAQGTARVIHQRVRSSTTDFERLEWKELIAGVLERRDRFHAGLIREGDLRLDLTVAKAVALTVPLGEVHGELGLSVGVEALRRRLGRLRSAGATRLAVE
jgi:hypothetical protein